MEDEDGRNGPISGPDLDVPSGVCGRNIELLRFQADFDFLPSVGSSSLVVAAENAPVNVDGAFRRGWLGWFGRLASEAPERQCDGEDERNHHKGESAHGDLK